MNVNRMCAMHSKADNALMQYQLRENQNGHEQMNAKWNEKRKTGTRADYSQTNHFSFDLKWADNRDTSKQKK